MTRRSRGLYDAGGSDLGAVDRSTCWGEVWRARRVLIVQHANDGFVVRQAKPSGDRSIPQAGSEDISSIGFVSRNLVTPHDREPEEVISDTSLSTHLSDPDELRISAPLPGEAIRIDDPESSPTESTVLAAEVGLLMM